VLRSLRHRTCRAVTEISSFHVHQRRRNVFQRASARGAPSGDAATRFWCWHARNVCLGRWKCLDLSLQATLHKQFELHPQFLGKSIADTVVQKLEEEVEGTTIEGVGCVVAVITVEVRTRPARPLLPLFVASRAVLSARVTARLLFGLRRRVPCPWARLTLSPGL
jgi:hypothetical protein